MSTILDLIKDNLKIDNIELSAAIGEKLYGNANTKIIKDKIYFDVNTAQMLNFNNIYSVKEIKKMLLTSLKRTKILLVILKIKRKDKTNESQAKN